MIYGIGVDIIDIPRFEAVMQRWGERFRNRIFTEAEIRLCERKRRPGPYFAVRFAAKEAFVKALGTGMTHGIAWRDIEVLRENSGRPILKVGGTAAVLCAERRIKMMAVSLSHEAAFGVAQVILEV